MCGVLGAVEPAERRPNRSGGYEELYKGELVCLGEYIPKEVSEMIRSRVL